MRPTLFAHVISFDEALARVRAGAVPIARTEVVSLAGADGRVAAADIVCPHDVPAFDRSAMDGYAVVASETTGATADSPVVLQCRRAVYTGDGEGGALAAGQCVAIATGAPMPSGATAVVMVEHTRREGDRVTVLAGVRDGQHVGRRGADMTRGHTAVRAGDTLTPARLGAIAAAGATTARVYAKPSVAIVSTGNEVVPPGWPLGPGQVYDINRFTLESVTRRHGGEPTLVPAAAVDTLEGLNRAIDAVSAHDIVVISGGSSVGERDLLGDVLRARGEILFHGIAIKPGKPTILARLGRTVVLGMPGNPTSCLSNAYLLLVPLVRTTARLRPWRPEVVTVPLARRITSTADRHQFYTVRVVNEQAEPAFKASGDITSMAEADGYIEVPVGVEAIEAGTIVRVTLF